MPHKQIKHTLRGLLLFDFVGHSALLKAKDHIMQCLCARGELLLMEYFTRTVALRKVGSGQRNTCMQVTIRAV